MSAAAIAQKQNYFAPSTTAKAGSSPKDGSRDVTHPPIPELLDPAYLDKLFPSKPPAAETGPSVTATQTGAEAGAAFMAALKAEGNKQYTQNSAHAFESTGNAVVDAFNGLSQATDPADFEPVLRRSWAVDPLLTVKLIFNLRSIHEGKSEREGFYRAWGWLYRNHPRTAVSNLSALVDPLIEKKLKESKKNKDDKDAKVEEDEDLVLLELEDEIEPRGLSHGYWKDLLNLLTLATEGQLDEGASQFEALHPNRQTRINARLAKGRRVPTQKVKTVNRARGHIQHTKGSKDPQTHDARVAASLQRDAEASDKAKTARQSKAASWRERVQKLLTESKPYKALYITIAQLFAKALEADIDILQRISDSATDDKQRIKLSFDISLCAKYAPSINGSHDRVTNIASAISELLWNKGKLRVPYDQAAAVSPSKDVVHDLRAAYTRWVLSPLRRFLQIPEIYMSANNWNEIPYKRVASTCMQKNKSHFFQHDQSRFSNYLKDVAAGKRTISGATLLPHSLVGEALKVNNAGSSGDPATQAEIQVIEAQWKTMVDKLKESGALDNSMAVCDVSGSMGHILDSNMSGSYDNVSPILPAVALSLVLSQVSAEPWANSFITFSQRPEIVKIDPTAGLVETVNKMVTAAWDMNTDFNAVFTKLILPMAIEHKLPKEAMIKRLFVFSDMEFDQSGGSLTKGGTDRWTTEHEKVVKAFEAAGYDCPDIVYWNLQGARGAKSVKADWEGVAVMSGFSSNMIKVFMDKGGLDEEEGEDEIEVIEQVEGDEVVVKKKEKKKMTPEDIMKKALNKPSYATLVVVD